MAGMALFEAFRRLFCLSSRLLVLIIQCIYIPYSFDKQGAQVLARRGCVWCEIHLDQVPKLPR